MFGMMLVTAGSLIQNQNTKSDFERKEKTNASAEDGGAVSTASKAVCGSFSDSAIR